MREMAMSTSKIETKVWNMFKKKLYHFREIEPLNPNSEQLGISNLWNWTFHPITGLSSFSQPSSLPVDSQAMISHRITGKGGSISNFAPNHISKANRAHVKLSWRRKICSKFFGFWKDSSYFLCKDEKENPK